MSNGEPRNEVLTTLIREELDVIKQLPKKEQNGTHRLTELLAHSEIAARDTRSDILKLAKKSHANTEAMLRRQDITNGRIDTLEENTEYLCEADLPERMDTLERHQGKNYAKIKKWERHKEKLIWSIGAILTLITVIGILRSAGIDVYRLVETVETSITETK